MDILLTCTKLKPGKQGLLTPDADGCYSVPVGGINCFNSQGQYYDATDDVIKLLTDPDSELQRQIRKGVLMAENGHPKREPGMRDDEFLARARSVYENRACCQIVSIWLDRDNFKGPKGEPIIAIMARVKPAGELAHVARDAFANRLQDVCFSIRGFTYERMVGGIKYKTLVDIRTFDMVIEPGIEHATKYHAPTLECFSVLKDESSLKITNDLIARAQAHARMQALDTPAFESAAIDLESFGRKIRALDQQYNFKACPIW